MTCKICGGECGQCGGPITVTGRYTPRREPNMQNLSPPMTDEEREMVRRVREAIWRHLTDHKA